MKPPTPRQQRCRIKIRQYKSRVILLLQRNYHRMCYLYHRHITCFDRTAYSLRLLDIEFLLKVFGVIGSGKLILEVGGTPAGRRCEPLIYYSFGSSYSSVYLRKLGYDQASGFMEAECDRGESSGLRCNLSGEYSADREICEKWLSGSAG